MIYDEENLNNISIYDLRNLARQVGVSSPTTCKKTELIQGITDILCGKKIPYKPTIRQGRPPKLAKSFDSIVKVIPVSEELTASTIDEIKFVQNDEDMVLEFNQKIASFDYGFVSQKEFAEGYLEILVNGIGLLQNAYYSSSETKNVVPIELIKKSNLRYGDYLKVEVEKLKNGEPNLVSKIIEINGKKPDYYVDKNRSENTPVLSLSTKINFDINDETANQLRQLPLYFGCNACITTNSLSDLKSIIYDVTDLMQNVENAKIIYLNPCVISREKEKLARLAKSKIFYCDFEQSFAMQQKCCLLAANHAKICCAEGENVILICDNLDTIANIYTLENGDIPLAKSIMALNINASGGGTITVVTGFVESQYSTVTKLYKNNADIIYATKNGKIDIANSEYNILDIIPKK